MYWNVKYMIQFQFQLDGEHLHSSKWAFEKSWIEELDIFIGGGTLSANKLKSSIH